MTRALLLLLIARVIAAPVALRPQMSDGPSPYRPVFRVCAWPPQKPGQDLAELAPIDLEDILRGDSCPTICPDAMGAPGPTLDPAPPGSSQDRHRCRALDHPRC